MEGTDDRILVGPKSRSNRGDKKILSSVWNQTIGSTVSRIQTIATVVETDKTSGNEVRKVSSFLFFQKVP